MASSASEEDVIHRNDERHGLLNGVRRKFKSAFAKSKKFKGSSMRQAVMGPVIQLTMNEAYVYLLLKRSTDAGEIPAYTSDVIFTAISAVEFIVGPLVVWIGYKRRIRIAAWWVLLATLAPLPLLFLPNTSITQENADLCNIVQPRLTLGTSNMVIGRTVMAAILGLVTVLARLVVWIHGIVFIDDYRPQETGLQSAIILSVTIVLINFSKYALSASLDFNIWLIYLMLASPLAIAVFKLFRTPDYYDDEVDPVQNDGRDFFPSICRTLSNKTAMIHTASLTLLVTAVWGFSVMNSDLVKTKYLVTISDETLWIEHLRVLLPLIIIVYMAVISGMKYSAPFMLEFEPRSAVKKSTIGTIIIAALVLLLTFMSCNPGSMVGLSSDNYTQPVCSSHCGCAPTWNKFAPVCSVNGMDSYYSPCHAGCTTRNSMNNNPFLTRCSCSRIVTDIVTPGACNNQYCYSAYIAHSYLLALLHGLTASATIAHVLIIIRAVDERDKAIALSLLYSSISCAAFLGGRWFFRKLGLVTCAFFQNERCEFHNSKFPVTLGISSFGLISISILINIASWAVHRHYVTKKGRVSSMVS